MPDIMRHVLDERIPRDLTPEAGLSLAILSTRERRATCRGQISVLASQVEPASSACSSSDSGSQSSASRDADLGLTAMSEDVARRLRMSLDRARSMARVQSVLTRELLDELDSRFVPAIPLKGVVVAERLYDDPAGRESNESTCWSHQISSTRRYASSDSGSATTLPSTPSIPRPPPAPLSPSPRTRLAEH